MQDKTDNKTGTVAVGKRFPPFLLLLEFFIILPQLAKIVNSRRTAHHCQKIERLHTSVRDPRHENRQKAIEIFDPLCYNKSDFD